MITNERVGDITVFLCTTEKEWEDMTSKGQIVYHNTEMDCFREHPELGPDVQEVVLRAKKTVPTFRIIRVTRRDHGRRDTTSD